MQLLTEERFERYHAPNIARHLGAYDADVQVLAQTAVNIQLWIHAAIERLQTAIPPDDPRYALLSDIDSIVDETVSDFDKVVIRLAMLQERFGELAEDVHNISGLLPCSTSLSHD